MTNPFKGGKERGGGGQSKSGKGRGRERRREGETSESAQDEAAWGGRYLEREEADLFPPLYSGGNK